MVTTRRSLAGLRILVTGGHGFLGRQVCDELRARGAEDLVVPTHSTVDFVDQAATQRFVADVEPDITIHLAAEVGGIGANRSNPGRYFYANMAMGLHVIEASRQSGVSKFVQVGTVCAYPKHTPVPFREDDLWIGYPEETNAPYGVAKKALLVMLQAYRSQYGFNGIYLLPVNLYGPGDNFDPESSHVIPALIRKFVEAKERGRAEVEVWGTGRASREFLHVQDAARGIVLATEMYDAEDPVNLGSGMEISIADLAATIARLSGYEGSIRFDPSRPDGQPRRSLDTKRARQSFGFEARVEFEEGLLETIEWWKTQRG